MTSTIFLAWGVYCCIRTFIEKGKARWGWVLLMIIFIFLGKIIEEFAREFTGSQGDKIISFLLMLPLIYGATQLFKNRKRVKMKRR